jgi:hypothetical protein
VTDRSDGLLPEVSGDILSSLLPGLGPVAGRLGALVRAEWLRNCSKALRAAEIGSGLTREDFAEWVEQEPRAIPLYLKVLWAAGLNGHDKTLKAMGVVLGQAAKATARDDEDRFEDAELALRAMADLTPRHFLVLAELAKSETVVDDNGGEYFGQFAPEYIVEHSGQRTEVVEQCLLNLAAAGLSTSRSVYGGVAYPITDLGRAVVKAVQVPADEI